MFRISARRRDSDDTHQEERVRECSTAGPEALLAASPSSGTGGAFFPADVAKSRRRDAEVEAISDLLVSDDAPCLCHCRAAPEHRSAASSCELILLDLQVGCLRNRRWIVARKPALAL